METKCLQKPHPDPVQHIFQYYKSIYIFVFQLSSPQGSVTEIWRVSYMLHNSCEQNFGKETSWETSTWKTKTVMVG